MEFVVALFVANEFLSEPPSFDTSDSGVLLMDCDPSFGRFAVAVDNTDPLSDALSSSPSLSH